MFSTYNNNDCDPRRNDNNELSDISDSAALIWASECIENSDRNYNSDRNCSYFNQSNNNNNNPIFIESDQMEVFPPPSSSSSSSSNGGIHEHLMILAATAAAATVTSSSPSSDSCNNNNNIVGAAESPHFSIRDPPLIRLSPTSPTNNNLYRNNNNRYNDEFTGLPDPVHNTGYSPNSVDWLSQELFVKTENVPGELTHSSLKRHSFNNSLSDTEFPAVRTRGWTNSRQNESRDFEYSQNSSPHLRSRKDMKRKRIYNTDSDFDTVINSEHNTPNSVEEFRSNINGSNFINLTESDGEGRIDDRSIHRDRLTPELPRRHFQWWPIKRHCPGQTNEDETNIEVPLNIIASTAQQNESSPATINSPLIEVGHISQYSPCSPPFYMCTGNNSETFGNYPETPDHNLSHSETMQNISYNNINPQTNSDNQNSMSNFLPNASSEYQFEDPITTSSNVSSYLRHILVPQLRNQRRYAVSNLPASFRDFSRLYLPPAPNRQCPDRLTPHTRTLESGPLYPRRSSSGSFVHATVYEPDSLHLSSDQIHRPAGLAAPHDNIADSQHLMTNTMYRRHAIPRTMNTFLRAYGLEEVQQRQVEEPLYPQLRDPRLHSESMRLHPFLRLSERDLLNPIDSRPGTHFSRPFAMYESQGNVESVIQLALHLETSWRGISPEELSRLPCHYYSQEAVDALINDRQDKCMVCLDEFMSDDQLRTLSCGHQYHVNCVDKWLKMNRTCPMCRSDAVYGSSSYLFVN